MAVTFSVSGVAYSLRRMYHGVGGWRERALQPVAQAAQRLIFLSYHKPNRPVADRLVNAIRAVLSDENGQAIADVWYDDAIVGGEQWEPTILATLSLADIILFLVTETAPNATYMWQEEFPLALERMQEGARIIPLYHSAVSAPIMIHPRTRGCHRLPSQTADRLGEEAWIQEVARGVARSVEQSLAQVRAPTARLAEAVELAQRVLTDVAAVLPSSDDGMVGGVQGSEIRRALLGCETALGIANPSDLARSLEVWRRRLSSVRVRIRHASPALSVLIGTLLGHIEEVQTWALDDTHLMDWRELQRPISRGAAGGIAERASGEIDGAQRELSRLSDASESPLEGAARSHLLDQGGRHLALGKALLAEPQIDAAALCNETAAFDVQQTAFASLVSGLGERATAVGRSVAHALRLRATTLDQWVRLLSGKAPTSRPPLSQDAKGGTDPPQPDRTDLGDLSVRDVMIGRDAVKSINSQWSMQHILETVRETPRRRYPVWRDDENNILGVVTAEAIFRAAAEKSLDEIDVTELMEPALIITTETSAEDALAEFLRRRERLAVAFDGAGMLAGLVTLEDILEEIVGDIKDAQDISVQGIRPQSDGSANVDGAVPIRDLNRMLGWDLPDTNAVTVSDILVNDRRRACEPGYTVSLFGYDFLVLRMVGPTITAVRVKPQR